MNAVGRIYSLRRFPALLLFCLSVLLTPLISLQADAESKPYTQKELQQIFHRGWYLLSQIRENRAGLDEAIDLLKSAAIRNPQHKEVYWRLAEITYKKAEGIEDKSVRKVFYQQALEHSRKALELDPDSVEAHFWIGSSSARLAELVWAFSALGMVKEGIRELKWTYENGPEHRYAVFAAAALGAIYSQAPWPVKDLEEAEKYAQDAAKRAPNLTLACSTLARVYFEMGEIDKARSEAERCLALDPPTYIWDAELYNWPTTRKLLQQINEQ